MTDDLLARFQKNLSQMNQEGKSPLAEMVEITLARKGADVLSGARRCAVPRWFNREIIASLVPESDGQPEVLLKSLLELPYVHELSPLGYAFRSDVRDYLGSRLREEDEKQYMEMHQRAHDYFDRKLRAQNISMDEVRWATLTQEQADNLREKLYHLLFIDPEQGYELLDRLFRGAHRFNLYGEAATLARFGKEHSNESLSVLNRNRLRYYDAVLTNANGNWEEAIVILQEILTNKELPAEFRAQVLSELGTIYNSVSKFDQAIELFRQSKQICDDLNDIRRSSGLANNLGNAYLASGDLSRAEKYFSEGLAGLTKVGDVSEQAAAYNNLGNIQYRKEEWPKAIAFYKKSLDIKQQTGDQYGAATTQVNLGTVYQRLSQDSPDSRKEAEQRSQAIDFYSRSLPIFRQLGARQKLAMTHYKLAVVYVQAGQLNLARENVLEALQLFEVLNLPEREVARTLAKRLGAI